MPFSGSQESRALSLEFTGHFDFLFGTYPVHTLSLFSIGLFIFFLFLIQLHVCYWAANTFDLLFPPLGPQQIPAAPEAWGRAALILAPRCLGPRRPHVFVAAEHRAEVVPGSARLTAPRLASFPQWHGTTRYTLPPIHLFQECE